MIKTVLGFDFGLRRIGVACGQTLTSTASPLTTLLARNGEPNWQEINNLITTWKPQALIVGIPLNMDGTEQQITVAAKNFYDKLAELYQLQMFAVDERLTTIAARERIFTEHGYRGLSKDRINSVAAQFILEAWLEENKNE